MTCSIAGCERDAKKRGWCDKHYQRWTNHGHPEALKRTVLTGTPEQRFWPRVDKSGACWVWMAGTDGVGYGKFNMGGRKIVRAHQFSYMLEHGPTPEGMSLDHICHNTLCVRPSHLRVVTQKQNSEHLLPSRRNSSTGHRGVSFHKATGKYRAYAMHHRKQHFAGLHDTPEEAAEAARQLRLSLFQFNDLDRKEIPA